MNKKEKITSLKREKRELEICLSAIEQSSKVFTSRIFSINSELEKLGTLTPI